MATTNVRREVLTYRYELRMQPSLWAAVQQAAATEFTQPAEFIRRAIVDKLRAEEAESAARKRAA